MIPISHREKSIADLANLLRQAAEVGPGYHGQRRCASQSERDAMLQAFTANEADAPPYLAVDPRWIERRAKIFEAGDYPDKGLKVTVADLERLAANFDLPVPIWIEHADSPLELGYLTEVAVEGSELFGLVSLTEEADALIERSGAKSLSVGLSPDLAEIRELSLVRNPRVATAQLFSDSIRFECESMPAENWRSRYESLVRRSREAMVSAELKGLVAQGRMTPAQVPFAEALMNQDAGIVFDGETVPVADLVSKLLRAQPRHSMLGERAPQPVEDTSSVLMLPEEVAFYRRHFPDVSLEAIAQKKTASA